MLANLANERYEIDLGNPTEDIYFEAAGAAAFTFNITDWNTGGGLFAFQDTVTPNNHHRVETTGTGVADGGLDFRLRSSGAGNSVLSTGDIGLSINTKYHCVIRWSSTGTKASIQVFDSAGVAVAAAVENTGLTTHWSGDLNVLQSGEFNGVSSYAAHIDHLMIADAYDEPLEDNFDVENYPDYGVVASVDTADSPVLDAEQNNEFTVSDFGSNINSAIIKDVATGNHLIDVSASLTGTGDGPYTYDMPDVAALGANILGTVFDSASHTHVLEVSDGTDTDTIAIVINPKAGWAVQEITSAVKTTGSVFENFLNTIADGTQVYYQSTETVDDEQPDYLVVGATGILETNRITGSALMVFMDTTAEMAINSEFEIDDHWTLVGNWSIGSGVASHTSGQDGDLYQTPALALVNTGTYEFIYPMANRTGGTATIGLIGGTAVNGTARSTNATHTESLVAVTGNNLIRIASSVAGAFDINSLSVKRTDVPGGIWKPFEIDLSNIIATGGMSAGMIRMIKKRKGIR